MARFASSFLFFYSCVVESEIVLPSFAKINWRLRVLGKRDDGFHELSTIFQTVSLADSLGFSDSDELSLETDSPTVPADGSNLVIRAARLLQEEFGVGRGARITLSKRIPAPGGLGGGSSNAAVALLGLSVLWGLEPDFPTLCRLAARLGSDVPFFLYGGTALGSGRGTEIETLPEASEKFILIAAPDIAVPTAAAFAALGAKRLTKTDPESILKLCRCDAAGFLRRPRELRNDLETTVNRLFPEIGRVRERLLEAGAAAVLLCGSGASVFGLFDKKETRQATLEALGSETDWRLFAVATVSRDEYRSALGPCRRLFPISF